MKHKDVYIQRDYLCELMSKYMDDDEIYDTLDLDNNLESDIIYRVSWPEHVINPRFNSDACYQAVETAEEVWVPPPSCFY